MNYSLYQMLYTNDEFVMAVGRLIMSSAKFESNIRVFIEARGQNIYDKATLGRLIKTIAGIYQLDPTTTEQLHFLIEQRNYFVHRLHSSLSEYPSNEFELQRFINRAKALGTEMDFFSNLINKATPV